MSPGRHKRAPRLRQKANGKQMKKIVVASREEALALITSGTNPMLVFSDEAPYGYKKDGSIAGRRGRKALSADTVAARAAAAALKPPTARAKTGPLVRTADAPHGTKKDGTPMLKRGRPTREVSAANRAAAAVNREARKAERDKLKADRKAARLAGKVTPLALVAPEPPATPEPAPTVEVEAGETQITLIDVRTAEAMEPAAAESFTEALAS